MEKTCQTLIDALDFFLKTLVQYDYYWDSIGRVGLLEVMKVSYEIRAVLAGRGKLAQY